MNTDRFWQIIEATCASKQEEQLGLFKGELDQLSLDELVEFERIFADLFLASYNWDLWLVAWLCQGGMCSDDGFKDFRVWLISCGRAIYETALQNPDGLVDVLSQTRNPRFELFGYLPVERYRERTGTRFPELGIPCPKEPSGGDWLRPGLKDRSGSKMLNRCVVFNEMGDEEFAAIERLFPRVWNFCVQEGIIKIKPSNVAEQNPDGRIPTPEEVARSKVDPNLEKTDFPAYLKALYDAIREEYDRRK